MTICRWGNRSVWVSILTLVSGCLVWGCLPADPKDSDPAIGEASPAKTVAKASKAPPVLDRQILRDRTFTEAPMLAERVRKGELPPVSERLPENPLVVVPVEEIGRYGGTLRRALTGDIVQTAGTGKTLSENLMGYERPYPNSIQLNYLPKLKSQCASDTASMIRAFIPKPHQRQVSVHKLISL